MPREALPLRRATKDDRAAVVRTLSRAFDPDPVLNWLVRPDAGRAGAIHTVFDVSFAKLTLPANEAWIAGDARGVALWTPPGAWSTLRALFDVPRLASAVGWLRSLKVLAGVNAVQKHHPTAPHWYLFALAVDPDAQGRGIGSTLLKQVLAVCDEKKEPAYLEASTRDNARLYARHGFAEITEVKMAADAPPLWPMWREPKG